MTLIFEVMDQASLGLRYEKAIKSFENESIDETTLSTIVMQHPIDSSDPIQKTFVGVALIVLVPWLLYGLARKVLADSSQ